MIYNTPKEFLFRVPNTQTNNKPRKKAPPKIKNLKEYKPVIQKTRKKHIAKAASFFVTLYLGTILAFCIPLRPTYSDTEKRSLSEFPDFTAEAFLTGDYFDDISLWFSDTFPFREGMTKASTFLKSLSGFST
ncbi:MAG: hypothetical protein IKC01_04745, partial [Clostridia bacterium]|nr:hypothetical protein [Clostridia bacterium]